MQYMGIRWRRCRYRLNPDAHMSITAAVLWASFHRVWVRKFHEMNHLGSDPQPPPCKPRPTSHDSVTISSNRTKHPNVVNTCAPTGVRVSHLQEERYRTCRRKSLTQGTIESHSLQSDLRTLHPESNISRNESANACNLLWCRSHRRRAVCH